MGDVRGAYSKIEEYQSKSLGYEKLSYIVATRVYSHLDSKEEVRRFKSFRVGREHSLYYILSTNSNDGIVKVLNKVFDKLEKLDLKYSEPLTRATFIDTVIEDYMTCSIVELKGKMASTIEFRLKFGTIINKIIKSNEGRLGSRELESNLSDIVNNIFRDYYKYSTANIPLSFNHLDNVSTEHVTDNVAKEVNTAIYSITSTKSTQGLVNETKVKSVVGEIEPFILSNDKYTSLEVFTANTGGEICTIARYLVIYYLSKENNMNTKGLYPPGMSRTAFETVRNLFDEFRSIVHSTSGQASRQFIKLVVTKYRGNNTKALVSSSNSRRLGNKTNIDTYVAAMSVIYDLYNYILRTGKAPEFTIKELKGAYSTGKDINITNISETRDLRRLLIDSIDKEKSERFSDIVGADIINGIDNIISPAVNNIGLINITDKIKPEKKDLPVSKKFISMGVFSSFNARLADMPAIFVNKESCAFTHIFKAPYIERMPIYTSKIIHNLRAGSESKVPVFPTLSDRLTTDMNTFSYYTLEALFAKAAPNTLHNFDVNKIGIREVSDRDYDSVSSIFDERIKSVEYYKKYKESEIRYSITDDDLFTELETYGFSKGVEETFSKRENLYSKEPFLTSRIAMYTLEETVNEVAKTLDEHYKIAEEVCPYLAGRLPSITDGNEFSSKRLYESIPLSNLFLANSMIHDTLLKRDLKQYSNGNPLGIPYMYEGLKKYILELGELSSRAVNIKNRMLTLEQIRDRIATVIKNGKPIPSAGASLARTVHAYIVDVIKQGIIPNIDTVGNPVELMVKCSDYCISELKQLSKEYADYKYVSLLYRDYIWDKRIDAYSTGDIAVLADTSIFKISGNDELIKRLVSNTNTGVKSILYSNDRLLSTDGKILFIEIANTILNNVRPTIDMLSTLSRAFKSVGPARPFMDLENTEYRLSLFYDFVDFMSNYNLLPSKITDTEQASSVLEIKTYTKPSLESRIPVGTHARIEILLRNTFDLQAVNFVDSLLLTESSVIMHKDSIYKLQKSGLWLIKGTANIQIDLNTISDKELLEKISIASSGAINETMGVTRYPSAVINKDYLDYLNSLVQVSEDGEVSDSLIYKGKYVKVASLNTLYKFLMEIIESLQLLANDSLQRTVKCSVIVSRYFKYAQGTRSSNLTADNILSSIYSEVYKILEPVHPCIEEYKEIAKHYEFRKTNPHLGEHVLENIGIYSSRLVDISNSYSKDKDIVESHIIKSHSMVRGKRRLYIDNSTHLVRFEDNNEIYLVLFEGKEYGVTDFGYLIPNSEIIPKGKKLSQTEQLRLMSQNPIKPIGNNNLDILRKAYEDSLQ